MKKIFSIGILLIICISLVGCGDSGMSDSDARFMAEDICKGSLKSPSSAKWGRSVTVTDLGDNKYSVSGTVEAQNSFGAMIKSNYRATFTYTGEGYKDGYCSIS